MSKNPTIKKLYGERPEHWMRNALITAGRSNDDISEFGFGAETFDADFGTVTYEGARKLVGLAQQKDFAMDPLGLTKDIAKFKRPNVMVNGRPWSPSRIEMARMAAHKITYDGKNWRDPNGNIITSEDAAKRNGIFIDSDIKWWVSQKNHASRGGFFKKLGRSIGKMTGSVVGLTGNKKAAAFAEKTMSNPIKGIASSITGIPVIGPAIEVTANAVAGSIMFPIQVAKNIAEGKRIDRAIYEPFKERVKEIQAVAPYVQSVVSFIPGIGTGVAATIGAANALMKGQPITDALIEGAKGAIPGGPIAAAAFDVGVAAIKGKPIDEVMMQAIPLPADQKKLIIQGANTVKDIANGKNVAESFYNNAKGYLPKEAQAAFDAGLAIAQGQNLQKITAAVTPKLVPALTGRGEQRIQNSPVLQAGLKVLTPANAKGYKVGLGFMAHKVNPTAMISLRRSLPPQEKKGFDIAVSTHVGTVRAPLKGKKGSPAERFGYYATQGLQGGKPSLNASMMKTIIKDPETRKGAGKAATEIKRQRNLSGKERGFWAWVHRTIKKVKAEIKEAV